MKKIVIFIFTIIIISSVGVNSQTKISLETFSSGGYEYNVFKSPEFLFNENTNQYFNKDELLVSDNFLDLEFDAQIQVEKKKKYNFEIDSKVWYRGYNSYAELNQKRFSIETRYEKYFTKRYSAGAKYNFKWTDKLGTSVTGDELIRSYKYFRNSIDFYLKVAWVKNLDFLVKSSFQYKSYYDDNSDTPLDNSNLDLEFGADYQMTKVHGFKFDFRFANKKYKYIPAEDKFGNDIVSYDNFGELISGYSLRHLQYYNININYALKLKEVKGLLINPGFHFSRRNDLYQSYQSYTAFIPDIRVRYKNEKWYFNLKAAYKQMNYDERFAYTFIESKHLLEYSYFKYDFSVSYKVYNPMELFLDFSSDNRDSNSELEYRNTRRPYFNYVILFGINASLDLEMSNLFK